MGIRDNWYHYVAAAKGGPEILEWQGFEPRPARDREIAVRVEASGVLLADVLWQMGITPVGPKRPFTPGYDVVGIVEEVGPRVAEFRKGQRVAAMINYGGYTEFAYLPEELVVPVPDGIEPKRAVAATTSYLTAYLLVHTQGKLQTCDVVLVHGAGGGTGSAIVELAHLAGARVYGTASKSKHSLVERKGGIPIDYKICDFAEVLRQREPQGIDFIVDPIGGNVTSRSLGLLKPRGKLVSIAMIQSIKGTGSRIAIAASMLRLPIWSLMHPGKKAFFWDVVAASRKNPAEYRHALRAVFQLLKEDRIDPEISKVMSLKDAPKAQQMLLDYEVAGKIVLVN
jgi:NADPH:quinone reductase-like Zn-dependent oxidoreductase